MKTQKNARSIKGIISLLLIAVMVLSTLPVTASAATVQDGYTMEVKSAVTDGYKAFITIGITGPADAVLSKTVTDGYNPAAPSLTSGNWDDSLFKPAEGKVEGSNIVAQTLEDNDGKDNTQDLVLTVEAYLATGEMPFAPDKVWKLHFQDLMATYQNDEYKKELDKKYKGKENFEYTEEEAKKLTPEVVLAKGTWDFDITFENADTRSIEFVKQPVTAKTCAGWKDDNSDILKDAKITSFSLRSFGATIVIDDQSYAPDFTSVRNEKFVYAVMKDGSQVKLQPSSGCPGEQNLNAERPIDLDNVDHVLLMDGTKLTKP